MRYLLTLALLLTSLATFGTSASAQRGPWGGYPPDRVNGLIMRVHQDLDSGYHSGWHFTHGDRDRLVHAEHQLRDFGRQWNRGRFDKDNLDDAISSIQHVVDNNHMSGPERDALWHDLDALRGMREAYDRHEIGRW